MTDPQKLLHDYIESRSEGAFRELVTRYVDMVYATALRRMNRDMLLAEEVTQTVFIDLSRKARNLPIDVMLGGWLHHHTGFVAGNMRRTEQRRRDRERQAVEMNAVNNDSDAQWRELSPALDDTIDRLETKDRDAIILRFFERRSLRAVGVALGTSEDAAQKRVNRALEKLREFLQERGVTLSIATLGAIMLGQPAVGAPTGLAAAICKKFMAEIAGASAAGTGNSISGALQKFKVAMAVGAVAVTLFVVLWPKAPSEIAKPPMAGSEEVRAQPVVRIPKRKTPNATKDVAPFEVDSALSSTFGQQLIEFLKAPKSISHIVAELRWDDKNVASRHFVVVWQTNAYLISRYSSPPEITQNPFQNPLTINCKYENEYWSGMGGDTTRRSISSLDIPTETNSQLIVHGVRAQYLEATTVLNFGIQLLNPGQAIWTGNHFDGTNDFGHVLRGELNSDLSGIVTQANFCVFEKDGRTPSGLFADQILEYHYDDLLSVGWIPSRVVRFVQNSQTKERRHVNDLIIRAVTLSDSPLPKSSFSQNNYGNIHTERSVVTNDVFYDKVGTNIVKRMSENDPSILKGVQ